MSPNEQVSRRFSDLGWHREAAEVRCGLLTPHAVWIAKTWGIDLTTATFRVTPDHASLAVRPPHHRQLLPGGPLRRDPPQHLGSANSLHPNPRPLCYLPRVAFTTPHTHPTQRKPTMATDLEALVSDLGIEITASNPCAGDADNWLHVASDVTLTMKDRSLGPIKFRQGTACIKPSRHRFDPDPRRHTFDTISAILRQSPSRWIRPAVADVVSCLATDYYACETTFEDWCAGFGYDTDSRSALETFLACQSNGADLRRFLGEHLSAVLEAAQDY